MFIIAVAAISLAIIARKCVTLFISPTLRTRGQVSTWRRLSQLCPPRTFTFIHFIVGDCDKAFKLLYFSSLQNRESEVFQLLVWTREAMFLIGYVFMFLYHKQKHSSDITPAVARACFEIPSICVSPKQKLNTLKGQFTLKWKSFRPWIFSKNILVGHFHGMTMNCTWFSRSVEKYFSPQKSSHTTRVQYSKSSEVIH